MIALYLLTGIFSTAYIILIVYYIYAWKKTAPFSKESAENTNSENPFVSIIIPARNEEEHILTCINSIYNQNYLKSGFEVIVIDDHSTDATVLLVSNLQYQNVKIVSLAEKQFGKKAAITVGINQSVGDIIITTDADCIREKEWLHAIISHYGCTKSKMIVSPVLLTGENTLLEKMQSQEMTILTSVACASIKNNKPILCSGANLIFERAAFLSVNGYDGNENYASGDDIFLMLKIQKAFPGQISYLKSLAAAVYTMPQSGPVDTYKQRKRWASKTFSYGFSHITLIAILVFLANFLILFSGIMSAINLKFVLVPIICFSAKLLVDFMFLFTASNFFNKKVYPFTFIIASVFYPIYVSTIGLIAPFFTFTWKGR